MFEISDNNQLLSNNQVNNRKQNKQLISLGIKKKLICISFIMFVIIILLLIIINNVLYETPSDYSFKAIYDLSKGKKNLFYNSQTDNVKIWIGGDITIPLIPHFIVMENVKYILK
jgi:hypothetical protein